MDRSCSNKTTTWNTIFGQSVEWNVFLYIEPLIIRERWTAWIGGPCKVLFRTLEKVVTITQNTCKRLIFSHLWKAATRGISSVDMYQIKVPALAFSPSPGSNALGILSTAAWLTFYTIHPAGEYSQYSRGNTEMRFNTHKLEARHWSATQRVITQRHVIVKLWTRRWLSLCVFAESLTKMRGLWRCQGMDLKLEETLLHQKISATRKTSFPRSWF